MKPLLILGWTIAVAGLNAATLVHAAEPFVCSGGVHDGQSCTADTDCPDGACVWWQGACNGGTNDGFACGCPGGTCSASQVCTDAPSFNTCDAGARAGACCDRDFNCAEGTCVGTHRICVGGERRAFPCLRNEHCPGSSCGSTGRRCIGICQNGPQHDEACLTERDCSGSPCYADFEDVSCSADEDCCAGPCPSGICIKPSGDAPECTFNTDCALGLECRFDRFSGATHCLPPRTPTPTLIPTPPPTPTSGVVVCSACTPCNPNECRARVPAGGDVFRTVCAPCFPPTLCTGDCGADRVVTVDEILAMVDVLLRDSFGCFGCEAMDANRDCEVSVDEIVKAVNNAQGVCPPVARCGGLASGPCGTEEFCELPRGMCLVADLEGECRHVRRCPGEVNPANEVCGCDGRTYGNDCARIDAGVAQDHPGPCETPGG